jgi:tetraacyldisaccharide 4'-kinase
LLPVAVLFAVAAMLRRQLYRLGVLAVERLPVPVVVVGNITVGGAGKTPLTLYLARALADRGRRPGIVSRGHGGEQGIDGAVEVHPESLAVNVGDEPLLLRRRSGVPVFVGRDRAAAGRALLAAYPDRDVIICDDGLQHYRLGRNVEIAVLDRRGLMNGWMLPAGPLREPTRRLDEVDALVLNGLDAWPSSKAPIFPMRLVGDRFTSLDDPIQTRLAHDFTGLRVHAVAGIGEPQRFFDHLHALGLEFESHAFPDHHGYQPSDLDFVGDAILTTEKDAVKFAPPPRLPVWVLPVNAEVDAGLATLVLEKLNGRSPA